MKVFSTVVAALAMLALATAAQASIVNSFTGGAPGQGLDMQGNFVYAVTFNNGGGQVVGDATFTNSASTAGVSTTGDTWASAPMGNFGAAMNSVLTGNTYGKPVAGGFDCLASFDLQPGTYKLQLLVAEQFGSNRQTDFDLGNNGTIDASFTSMANGSNGTVVTDTVTMASAGTYTVRIFAIGYQYNDQTPVLNAATIEAVPEPATMSLLAIGALGALIRRKK